MRTASLLLPLSTLAAPVLAAEPAPPVPVTPLPRLLTNADYPAEALRLRQQGNVRVRLDVGPNGRVTGCLILRSSGSRWLDSASCTIMVRRARFRPARDAAGRPAAGSFEQMLAWRIAAAAAPAPADAAVSAADLAEIDSLLRRWEAAWQAGDAVAWSELFHEDGTWVLWTGGEWRGRAQIARDFAPPLATVYRDSIQRIRLVEARRLAPDVIVARILSTTTGDSRQPGVAIYGNKMLVLTRRAGRWLILYGQNTRLNEAEAAKLQSAR